jgi:hypothetical protein
MCIVKKVPRKQLSFFFSFKGNEDILLLKKKKKCIPPRKIKITNESCVKNHFTLELSLLGWFGEG